MSNIKFKRILQVSFVVLATVVASIFLGMQLTKPKQIYALDPKSINLDFKVGEVSVTAFGYNRNDNQYTYSTQTNTRTYINGPLSKNINQNQNVMLRNYEAQNRLISGSSSEQIKNIYISIGAPYDTVMSFNEQAGEKYGDRGVLLASVNVTAKINGIQFKVNNYVTEETEEALSGINFNSFKYWYQYIDLTTLEDNFTGQPIYNTEGHYEFTFTYSYVIKDGSIYKISGSYNYTFEFYLINETTYTSNYPTLTNATVGNKEANTKIEQFFYNFQTLNQENPTYLNSLPTLTYDASLYNISYTREKDNQTIETVTTSFTKQDTSGILTINSSLTGTTQKTIPNVNNAYFTTFVWDELSTYTILISYVVNVGNNEFKIIPHEEIPAYNITRIITEGEDAGQNPYLIEDGLQKSYYKLHIFGFKAYFLKNNQNLHLNHNGIEADYTARLNQALGTNKLTQNNAVKGFYSLVNDNKFPETNLPPISFSSYGTLSYGEDQITPISKIYKYSKHPSITENNEPETIYLTKNTQIYQAGYYEVVIAYTYQNYSVGNDYQNKVHYQVFVFRIDNSTPTVNLLHTPEGQINFSTIQDKFLDDSLTKIYTNKNVYVAFKTSTYFKSNIRISAEKRNYDNTGATNLNVITNTFGTNSATNLFTDNGKYVVRVYYSESNNLYIEYSFTIDKNSIANVKIQPINKADILNPNNNDITIVTDTNLVNFENKILINQPFTLTYSQKQSGAKITTTYQKIPFTAYLNGGQPINQDDYKNYITTNYEINYKQITSTVEYVLDYNVLTTNVVNPANAFMENSSFIYIFKITDEAGNQTYKYVIYDLTTPQVIVTPEINNPYNIVSNQTNIFWGTHKAVLIKDSSINIDNQEFRDFVQNNTTLFNRIDGNYYLVSPITTVKFTQILTGETRTFTQGQTGYLTNVNFLPEKDNSSSLTAFFSGQNSYSYSVSDSSNIFSMTNIAKNNAYNGSIWMNLDNSLAILYGKHFGAVYTSGSSEYGEALNWDKRESNVNQLRLTYKPGEEGTDYEVKSFTYTYYEFAPNKYTSIASGIETNYEHEEGEYVATYPFNSTPSIIRQPIPISNLTIPGETEGNNRRVVSEVINPTYENGQVETKPGLYVFRREYNKTLNGDYSKDPVVNFYYFIIDRDRIINITGEDEDIYSIVTPNANSILYQTGSGINFKFTNNPNDTSRYSAKQIQQYIQYTQLYNLFDSNKLPIKLNLPNDKYNTQFTLQKAIDAPSYANLISQIVSKKLFTLDYQIKFENTIIANTQNNYLNPNYITIETNNGYRQLAFKNAGKYSVTLLTTNSAEISTNYHPKTTYYFEFTICHTAPTGNYYSVYKEDGSDMLLTQKLPISTNLINFYSTNKNELKFVFSDNVDPYKANININAITVKRTSSLGTTSAIYTKTASGESVPGVFSSKVENGVNVYTLNLTNFINQQEHYNLATYTVTLQFIGNESDYIIPTGQGSTNYFKRDFKITVDRIKPTYNYNQLLNKDNNKYNAQNVSNLDIKNYFFAVDNTFKFEQNEDYGKELDSNEIFIRPLEIAQNGLPNYYYSTTPDEEPKSNHPIFSESSSNYIKVNYYTENGKNIITAQQAFESLVYEYNTNFFEVVERDEAGNYRIYAVQYSPLSIAPQIYAKYKLIGNENFTNILIDEQFNSTISGTDFTIEDIESSDLFLKAIISYGNQNIVIVNNPYDNTPKNSFDNFITRIQNALQFSKTQTSQGYNIKITFVNRFYDNYEITYLVPGELQKPIFRVLNNQRFTVTIPPDTESTKIEQFRVWKFENNNWIELKYTMGTLIRNGVKGGQSLQNESYTFEAGEYKFQLIDNFGRGENTDEYPPAYFGLGVNNVNEINYGTNKVVNGVTYTAGPVTLKFQSNLYELKLYKYVIVDGVETKVLLNDEGFSSDPNIKQNEINNQTKVRTIVFSLDTHNAEQRYEVQLLLHRNNQTFTYDFVLYKKLPNIVLRTLSGSYLNPNSSPFTENFLVTWSNDVLDFTPSVTLYRTYTSSNGKIVTDTISNIPNGYQVSLIGNYVATIKNSLGYTHSANNLNFQLVTGSVVVYEVLTIANGIETSIKPSPITSLINVNGVEKVVYKYYVSEDFNGNVNNHSVQIRVNTNKALQIEDINETNPTLNPNLQSKMYRIFGTGEYGYERYIEIIFVPKNSNFANLAITYETTNEEGQKVEGYLNIAPVIKNTSKSLKLVWSSYNSVINQGITGEIENDGNIIYADYYFNGKFVKTIYNYNKKDNNLEISSAGIHKLIFYDLAGNRQLFKDSNGLNHSEITINLINNVTFLVNNEEPINNIIVNNRLNLQITNRNLYDSDPVVTAKKDGKAITVNRVGTSGYNYVFTTQGYYEITMNIVVRIDGNDQLITTTYNFVLINSQQKQIAFNLPQNYGFTVESVIYEGTDISYNLPTNELWLSPASVGIGQYYITLKAYVPALDTYRTFQFELYIYDEVPEITSSIEFGGSTTKNIEIYYNPYKIYDSLGESIIRVRLGNSYTDYKINAQAQNTKETIVLNQNGTYFIEILTSDEKLVTSYKFNKKEPLNTTSIIVIVIASVVFVGLSTVFLIIRKRFKFR